MTLPINDPSVPLTTPFNGPLYPGKMVTIRGIALLDGDRFDINFQTRPTCFDTDDIAFHISVRLLQGYIARNSFRNGNWEDEEGHGGLPIHPGQGFEILILVEESQYRVAINGVHYCNFGHRLPYQAVTHLGVDGDVTLSMVGFGLDVPPAYGSQTYYGVPGQQGMYAPNAMPGQQGMYPPNAMPGQQGMYAPNVMPGQNGMYAPNSMPSAPPPYGSAVTPIAMMNNSYLMQPRRPPTQPLWYPPRTY